MSAGFWLLMPCQWSLPELFWVVKCVIVETSSLVFLKIFSGTSLMLSVVCCGGLVSHMCSSARGEVWKGCTVLHGPACWEMLQHPGLPWSTDGRGNYSYSSKRINNFNRQPHASYSFPHDLELAGPCASWLSQENQLWVNISSRIGEFPEHPVFPLN